MLYMISVHTSHRGTDGVTRHASLPTFFLNSDIQGIVSAEHAATIARDMVAEIFRITDTDTGTAEKDTDTDTDTVISVDARPVD